MPDDALPQPWPTQAVHTARYRREYRDPLGRPMRGTLTISGATRTDTADVAIVPTPVNVTLVDGVLEADLPPGDYTLTGQLTNVDGARIIEEGSFTLPPAL